MQDWVYGIYFSQISNTANHYQYLIVLIIGASSYLFSLATSYTAKILIAIAWICSVINLIIGLLIYNQILKTLFDFTISPDKPNLTDPIKCYFLAQIIIGILSIILTIIGSVFIVLNKKEYRK